MNTLFGSSKKKFYRVGIIRTEIMMSKKYHGINLFLDCLKSNDVAVYNYQQEFMKLVI